MDEKIIHFLSDNASNYGFLGGIVGIAGLMLGATGAILFGFTRAFDDWKPQQGKALAGLDRFITALCAIAMIAGWLWATPLNMNNYMQTALWMVASSAGIFVLYVGLRVLCGRFRKPLINAQNEPAGTESLWGGFWLTPSARQQVKEGSTVEDILAGNEYKMERVWPASSLALSAMASALFLLIVVACGGSSLALAATAAQCALTGKPAIKIFESRSVPGISSPTSPTPSMISPK